MRDIKFKILVNGKEWCYGLPISFKNGKDVCECEYSIGTEKINFKPFMADWYLSNNENYTLCQYVGKDRLDRDVYENDILKINNNYYKVAQTLNGWELLDLKTQKYRRLKDIELMAVIGNVFDTTEKIKSILNYLFIIRTHKKLLYKCRHNKMGIEQINITIKMAEEELQKL